MTQLSERYLKTGGDPRTLPDYATLRDEINKQSHPARPDINWNLVQKKCLALFEQNGVELQTAAWYTQARMQLAGLAGLNEGLAIIEAVVGHHWGDVWPYQMHARVEIFSGMSQRIQQMMRTLPINYSELNLSHLYRAEQHLVRINEVLQHFELKYLSQLDVLAALMHNIGMRLEESDDAMINHSVVQLVAVPEPTATLSVNFASKETPESVKRIYVAEPPVKVAMRRSRKRKPWRPFVAGMCVMLVTGTAAVLGWNMLFPRDPLLLQLEASITPLIPPLSKSQLETLLPTKPQLPENIVEQTQQQLSRIEKHGPGWSVAFGHQLIAQLQLLKPEDDATKQMAQKWQQQLNATALPVDAMGGWHQGMSQLQQLSAKLDTLDNQRGKYITVSELKSVIYTARQAFNRSIPAEEQLRLYSTSPSDIQKRQTEMALEQLQKRYFLLSLEKGKENL